MIEVKGANGESIIFDGTYVAKFRHGGKQEAAKNPVTTYRQVDVKAKKRKGDREQEYDVMVFLASIMSLTITESEKPRFDELVAAMEAAKAANG